MAVAGHELGGNLATCLSAVLRDRAEFSLKGRVLLAPLLDLSMTRVARASTTAERHSDSRERADNYSAYLSKLSQRTHPYAAPMESKRLTGLPPALIATSAKDVLHIEAEEYSCELINAGVPTEVTRYLDVSHEGIVSHARAIDDTVAFLRRKLR
jgi:acetyl esterase